MENCRRGHARDPPGNMHTPAFRLLTVREWGGACTSWRSGRGDTIPITGVFPFLSFLSLTLSKGLFTSNLLSQIVGPISRFFEIGFFPKMEKYWAVPPILGRHRQRKVYVSASSNVWRHKLRIPTDQLMYINQSFSCPFSVNLWKNGHREIHKDSLNAALCPRNFVSHCCWYWRPVCPLEKLV